MPIYRVIDKATGLEANRYSNDVPVAWPQYPVDAYDTVEMPEPEVVTPPAPSIEYDAFDFVQMFPLSEHAAIMASADHLVQAFLFRLQIAAAQGRKIVTTDETTAAGMAYLLQQGLISHETYNVIMGAAA